MKNRDIYWKRYKIQETLYIKQWRLSPLQSRHLETSHNSPNHPQLPRVFSWILSRVWKVFPFKDDFSLGKSQKSQGDKSGLKGVWVNLGDLMFHQKNSAWDVMHERACCDEVANHQLPVVVAFWNICSFCRGMFTLNTKFDADSLLYLLSHFECVGHSTWSLNSIYHPHWLVQWSCHCSCMRIPVHSPWLPGYIDTILVIFTMAGLFPDLVYINK